MIIVALVIVAIVLIVAGPLARWADHDPDARIPGNGLFGVERRADARIEGPSFVPPALDSATLERSADPTQLVLRFDHASE